MLRKTPEIVINFAHANGFPAGSYRKLWRCLPEHFEIIANDKFGHNQHLPVNDNWQNQVAELIQFVERRDTSIYAVGHSFGGVISFMAACLRPDLFKGLIMLDPPIMAGNMARVLRLVKKTSYIDKITPAGKSKLRKSFWQKGQNPVDYFRPKALFKYFDPDCLQDYVESATQSDEQGVRLSFEVDVETAIFRKIPHNINQFKNKLQVPARLFTAEHTNVCFPRIIRPFTRQHRNLQHDVVPGVGHMFPFEKPQHTANLIAETILQWERQASVVV